MKKRSLRIVRIAVAAAMYTAMSLVLMPLTFGLVQVRFAEMLLILCFFDRDYCYALVLGCIVTNFFSPLGIVDVLFGGLGTLLSVIGIRYTRRIYLTWIPPVIFNVTVALEYFIFAGEPFWLSSLTIAAGELISVGVIGVPVFMLLERKENFLEIIGTDERYRDIRSSIESKRDKRRKDNGQNDGQTDSE